MRFDQLASMTGGTLCEPTYAEVVFTGVSIDSRSIRSAELFIAIRGEKHDGHRFLNEAAAAGAAGVLIARDATEAMPASIPTVQVVDTHDAMLTLGRKYYQSVGPTTIAITGSNGKTTIKEMTYQLLRAVSDNVYRSSGNLNNLYGLPLALMSMPQHTQWAVLEMGVSMPGEMSRLAGVVEPDLIVISNVGASHLEFLNTVDEVATEKLSLMAATQGKARLLVNGDDPVLISTAKKLGFKFAKFGLDSECEFKPDNIETSADGRSVIVINEHRFRIDLPGKHQPYNFMAAYAVTRMLGFSFDGVDTYAISLGSTELRGQVVKQNGVKFFLDCYNANPDSVQAGLAAFYTIKTSSNRVLILGDMLELGETSNEYHYQLGQSLATLEFSQVLFVGDLSRHTMSGAIDAGISDKKCRHFENADSCAVAARDLINQGDFVFLKGSRGIALEKILARFKQSQRQA